MKFQRLSKTGKSFSFLILLIATQWITLKVASANSQTVSPRQSESQQKRESKAGETPTPQEFLPKSICPASLPGAIEAIASRPQFSRARWGMSIQTLSNGQTLYTREANRYFIPASSVKLLTTAAALRQLGANYRIRTSIYGNENLLRVVGRGDPSLTDAELKDLAKQLKQRGIRQVKQLIVEDGYFQGQMLNPDWEFGDVYASYGVSVNSLILNQNAIALTLSPQEVGQPLKAVWSEPLAALQWELENQSITVASGMPSSAEVNGILGQPVLQIRGQLAVDSKPVTQFLAIRDPGKYFLQHFRTALAAEGIAVAQASVTSKAGNGNEAEIAFVESPNLSKLIADTNQPSNNLYAEVLLRSLGISSNSNSPNSAEQGLTVVKDTLTQLGVDASGYVLADGSGLSRHNLVSPEALVQMLKAMSRLPDFNIFRASLPVAGVSGTLSNRFKNTPAQGIVQAKTGTLSGNTALSGYVDAPNYETVVFSIIVNQSEQSAAPLRQAVDEMVVLLTRLKRC
ncbi:MAG TPA: D-alanyl-D-alanine carboxypeptidase/D-alanyl-D-alanine-endopeptidase [Cyanobacteria bacterium UBA11369]|nr:D-alanyl-D-alanine carboxypeptidase/D-alanyl-D-alanine-endopeptidase [Cyanobacteria bacterium UBA11371]HBE54420.1 D-alanyl-D-alanine carboxypeptidase/D-alanyl-D-alanine-endopeptidase [Cyanobacteria bacterium UBA11369]